VATVVPVLIYPFTYTMWLAFDLAVHPPEAAELQRAQAAVASGSQLATDDQRRSRSR
jgi:hypothetical protein